MLLRLTGRKIMGGSTVGDVEPLIVSAEAVVIVLPHPDGAVVYTSGPPLLVTDVPEAIAAMIESGQSG